MTEQTLHWPERVRNLPMTLDRFRAASVFFEVKYPPFLAGHLDAQKWISWGSLSAVASIPEVFEREIHVLGFAAKWRSSPERDAMRNDQFLATLKELRNYETHLRDCFKIQQHLSFIGFRWCVHRKSAKR